MSWNNLNNLSVSLPLTKLMKGAKVRSCLWSFLWCFLPALCFHVCRQAQQIGSVPKYINFLNAGRVYRVIFFPMASGFSSKLNCSYNSNGTVLHDSFLQKLANAVLSQPLDESKHLTLTLTPFSRNVLAPLKHGGVFFFFSIVDRFIKEMYIVAQYGMFETNSPPIQSQQQG